MRISRFGITHAINYSSILKTMHMKQILLLGLLLICSAGQAQTFDKSDVALAQYWVILDDNLGAMRNQDLYDSVYMSFGRALINDAGYKLQPINALKNKVPYNVVNYPAGSPKKAAKQHQASGYVKLIVQITTAGFFTSSQKSMTVGGVGLGVNNVNAHIRLIATLTRYDATGKKIDKLKVDVKSPEKIEVSEKMTVWGNVSIRHFDEQMSEINGFNLLLRDACTQLAAIAK